MQFAKMDSLRTWTAVGLCFSFAWLHSLVLMARADTVYNGGTCSGILDGGIYDTIYASQASVSFSDIKDALCSQQSDYSYENYMLDKYHSTTDKSQLDKGYCKSQAHNVDAAAAYLGISLQGGYNDKLQSCDKLATRDFFTDSKQFNTAQTDLHNAASAYCAEKQGVTMGSAASQLLSKTASPTVFEAYKQCLAANTEGLQTAVTYPSGDSTSVVVTIKFIYQLPDNDGKGAQILGHDINPDGAAICKLYGEGVTGKAASLLEQVHLKDKQTYSITCKLNKTKRGDISIFTNKGHITITILDRTELDKPKAVLPASPDAPPPDLPPLPQTPEQKTFADTFPFPSYKGLSLDWCMDIGIDCGLRVAQTFCKARGYDQASSFDGPYNLPIGKTLTFRTEKSCEEPPKCFSFKSITCTGAATRYYFPRLDGQLLDWCATFEQECGQPAADAFCNSKGFTHSTGWGSYPASFTLTIKGKAVCDARVHANGCLAFDFLDCVRYIPFSESTPPQGVLAAINGH